MSSQLGAMFENLFASEALRRNLNVSRPDHHACPFDMIISNESGKLFRVQVKGTGYKQKLNHSFGFTTASRVRGSDNLRRKMKRSEFDLFVGIVEEPGDRIFYIIPASELTKGVTSIRVFPKPDSKAKYERFRNAWSLFE